MSPFSDQLTAFELEALVPDGYGGQHDRDLDEEDRDLVESAWGPEVAVPGRW
jgi:hypothetical protein